MADPGAALILLPLDALTVPSMLLRKATYTARRRRDWSVSVYQGIAPDYRPRRALVYQACPTRDAGVDLAGSVSARLAAGWHPQELQAPLAERPTGRLLGRRSSQRYRL